MADVSVRPARPEDAAQIARIQLGTWRVAYATLLPRQVLDAVDHDRAAAQWGESISRPPSPHHHVLVALEREEPVGFVAFGPAAEDEDRDEPTGSVLTLLVEPRWGRRGHGSRLLAAAVDHLREAGMTSAIAWVLEGDPASVRFYGSAGWEPDGYARGLDADGHQVREIRLHTSLAESEEDVQP